MQKERDSISRIVRHTSEESKSSYDLAIKSSVPQARSTLTPIVVATSKQPIQTIVKSETVQSKSNYVIENTSTQMDGIVLGDDSRKIPEAKTLAVTVMSSVFEISGIDEANEEEERKLRDLGTEKSRTFTLVTATTKTENDKEGERDLDKIPPPMRTATFIAKPVEVKESTKGPNKKEKKAKPGNVSENEDESSGSSSSSSEENTTATAQIKEVAAIPVIPLSQKGAIDLGKAKDAARQRPRAKIVVKIDSEEGKKTASLSPC